MMSAALMAACRAGAETAAEAAQRLVSAYNRGDSGAIYDMLIDSERKAWEELAPSLPGGREAGYSPRDRFASMVQQLWGDNRGFAEVLHVDATGDTGTATFRFGGEQVALRLVREGREWRFSHGQR